jgi:hypothetical protein
MDRWDKARRLMLEQDLCLFFSKDGRFYGAPENSRITFARMKNPDSDEDAAWMKDASFSAYDLEKVADGEEVASVFTAADLPEIKTVGREKAEKALKKKGKKIPAISEEEGDKSLGEE